MPKDAYEMSEAEVRRVLSPRVRYDERLFIALSKATTGSSGRTKIVLRVVVTNKRHDENSPDSG
jgi:hypothetical protein